MYKIRDQPSLGGALGPLHNPFKKDVKGQEDDQQEHQAGYSHVG